MEGPAGMTHPVFISYARSESAAEAHALRTALGPEVAFLDRHDLDGGQELPAELAEALLASRVVVVFATPSYFTRWYCLRELQLALAPYGALIDAGADAERRREAVTGIVVALGSGAAADVLDQLPPVLRTTVWPESTDTSAVAALVHRRLAEAPPPFGERLQSRLPHLRDAFLEQAAIPPPQSLAGVTVWGPPGEPQPSLGDGFVGRTDELWRIHHELRVRRGNGQAAALTGALQGGGGFGKTRLASEYFHRFGPTFYPGGLLWVRGDLEAVPQLHAVLSFLEEGTPDLREFAEAGRDLESELARALDRRAAKAPVLYVVDNVPEPRPGEAPPPLSTWCPAPGRVSLLVTSRASQAVAGAVTALPVDVLASDAGVALLTRGYGGRRHLSERAWRSIAEWVGNLPLALEVLNASLRAGALEPSELLDMVFASPVAGVDRVAEDLSTVVARGSIRGITEAFMFSYQRLAPHAQEAARLLAHLSPAPIPLALAKALGDDVASPGVRATLRTRSFLMGTGDPEGDIPLVGRMHAVMADFLRRQATDASEELLRACAAAAAAMDVEHPEDPHSWPFLNACLPHAEALFLTAGGYEPGSASCCFE